MLTETEARKSSDYWATMRQNMALLYRGGVPESTRDAIRSELSDILDSNILNYPRTLLLLGIEPEMTYTQRREALGVETVRMPMTVDEGKLLYCLKSKAELARKFEWQFRIAEENIEKTERGWYPFFITLTVDPKLADPEQIMREGRELRKYIRRLCKVVTDELGHPESRKKTKHWDYRPESDYITYAAVVEHGKSRNHHHMHLIVWMREIPARWKICPNAGIAHPGNRRRTQCLELNSYWPWSAHQVQSKYFRSIGNRWDELGFILPIGKNGEPQKIAPPAAAGAYLTKYMTKEYKEWHHRMKCTRNLGLSKIRNWMKIQSDKTVQALSLRPATANTAISVTKTHTVPLGLIRSEATRNHYWRTMAQNRQDFRTLMTSNSGIFSKMLRSARLGIRPDRMHSTEFYDWVSGLLGAQRGYCEQSLIEAHDKVSLAFPKILRKQKYVKIGAKREHP